MKVILLEDIKKLGRTSEEVDVKRGFGRYLINYKKALYATKENLALVHEQKKVLEEKRQEIIKEAQLLSDELQGVSLVFEKTVQENGKLFGSINKKNILLSLLSYIQSKKLEMQKTKLTPESILLTESIKVLGEFNVKVGLNTNIKDIDIIVKVKPL